MYEALDEIDFDMELDYSYITYGDSDAVSFQRLPSSVKPVTNTSHNDVDITDPPDFVNQFNEYCCEHEECNNVATILMACGFCLMNVAQRVAYIGSMIFEIAAPAGEWNSLMKPETISSRKRKKNGDLDRNSQRTTTVFEIKGKLFCLNEF